MKRETQKTSKRRSLGAKLNYTLLNSTAMLAIATAQAVAAATPVLPSIPAFRTSVLNVETPEFRLATKLPVVPESVPMMTTSATDAEEQLVKVAEVLGLEVKLARNGKGKLATRHQGGEVEQQTLTVFEASGGFFYRYDNLLHAIPKEQARLPKDAEAFEIASNFLQKNDLLPKDILLDPQAAEFSQSQLSEFDAKTGKTLQSYTTSVEVRFPQQWAGIPVTGPGSKLYVAIGDKGKVLGLTHMLRGGEESGIELKTIAPEQALRRLQSGQANLAIPAGCQTASIEAMTLAYWSESPKASQRTALPLYEVSGTCHNRKGQSLGSFQAYTAAVLQPPEYPEAQPRHQDYEQDIDG